MEATQRFHFIKTLQQGESWVAMIADAEALGGLAGVEALRSASRMSGTFNGVKMRGGVHFYTAEQLDGRLPELEKQGMDKSAEAFRLAQKRLHDRTAGAAATAAPKRNMAPA